MESVHKLIFALFLLLMISCHSQNVEVQQNDVLQMETNVAEIPSMDFDKTKRMAQKAFDFCKSKKYNTDFCILIDMSVHSGLNRLVVWDFKSDTIEHTCLVGHGSGQYAWNHDYTKENPTFSNVENSHCSSLGKYRIGQRAPSDWGVHIKYVIHGLETTNSNAAKRFVVFHSWDRVPDEEIYPDGTPEGWGCPIVSLENFKLIDKMLTSNPKSTLMWIYTEE